MRNWAGWWRSKHSVVKRVQSLELPPAQIWSNSNSTLYLLRIDSTQTSQSPARWLNLPGANQSWGSWLGPKRVKGCVHSLAAQGLPGTHTTQESTCYLHSHHSFHAVRLTWPSTWSSAQLHRKGRYLQQRPSVSLPKPAQTKATMMLASKREKSHSLGTSEHCLPSAGGSYARHVNYRRAWKSENLQPSWFTGRFSVGNRLYIYNVWLDHA